MPVEGRKTAKSMMATAVGNKSVPNNESSFRGGGGVPGPLRIKYGGQWRPPADGKKVNGGAGTARSGAARAVADRNTESPSGDQQTTFSFPVPPKFVPIPKKSSLKKKKSSLSFGSAEQQQNKRPSLRFRLRERSNVKHLRHTVVVSAFSKTCSEKISQRGLFSDITSKQTHLAESVYDSDYITSKQTVVGGFNPEYTTTTKQPASPTVYSETTTEQPDITKLTEGAGITRVKDVAALSDNGDEEASDRSKSSVETSLVERDVIAQRALQRGTQSEKTLPTQPVSSSVEMTKTLSDTIGERPKRRPVTRDVNHVSHQFFHVEPCIYTHRMFQRAATIFSVLKDIDTETEEQKAMRRRQNLPPPPSEKIPDMEFLDAHEQIKTFELGFATLKYQKLFQEILHKTIFFQDYPELRDAYSLVCIILYDLQSRKFQRRVPLPGETVDALCGRVEDALLARQTKLLSTIAKERIRHGAPSIEFLLPESVRHKDETKSRIPVYCWVNQTKQCIEEFLEELETHGFAPCDPRVDMSAVTEAMGHVYRVDRHCPDLVLFPPHMAMYFKDSHWVKHGRLVQQDKSSCLAPHTVKNLLAIDHDVIHVNVGTGMSTGHIASLLWEESSKSHLWAFGIDGSEKAKKVIRNLDVLGANKNTKVVLEDFLSTDPEDPRFRHVRVILIEANCSKSAITSPVQFIVSEGEDMQILGELSKAESDMGHVASLMKKHERQLKHALKFSKVAAVVYCTRSRYDAENEAVVTKAVDYTNLTQGRTGKPPFRVSPPVIPFSSEEVTSGQSGIDGRFVRFRPSDKANGCFVAIISREPEEPKDAASSALAKKAKKKAKAEAEAAEGGGDAASGGAVASKSSSSTGKKRNKKSKKNNATVSLPDVGAAAIKKSSMRLHKAASSGAREYQNSLLAAIKKSSSRKVALEGEEPAPHVVKHPSPFRSNTLVMINH